MQKINFKKYTKYLPSKTFSIILGVFILLILIVMISSSYFIKNESFTTKKVSSGLESIEGKTIDQIINTDSDLDSVMDWEETLWGTDKEKQASFENIPDATYIANKKKELNIEQEQDDKKLTETEAFARNFFTAYTALKTTGQVSDDEINDFSKALGEKIADDTLEDKYNLKDIKLTNTDDSKSKVTYYNQLKAQFEKYESTGGLGDELGIVSNEIAEYQNTKIEKDYPKLTSIGNSYSDFANSIVSIPVPESLKDQHLKIVNAANNTGISLVGMAKAITDPIVGIGGLSKYQRYSKEFVDAVEVLETLIK